MNVKIGVMGAIGVDDIGDIVLLQQNLSDLYKISREMDINLEFNIYTFDVNKSKEQIESIVDIPKSKINLHPTLSFQLYQEYFKADNLNVNDLQQEIKINSNYKKSGFYKSLVKCDALYFIGGGYFNEYWGEKLWPSFVVPLLTSNNLNKPTYISAVTLGPFSDSTKGKLQDLFNNSSCIVLRDHSNSVNILKDLQYTKGSVLLNVDDILMDWSVTYKENSLGDKFYSNEKYMVLHIFHWAEKYANNIREFYTNISGFLDYILENKYIDRIYFMPFNHFRNGKKGGDYIYGERIKDYILNKDKLTILQPLDNYTKMRKIIRNAEFVIANRYHPVVFSLGDNTPVLGIYVNDLYKQKLQGTYEVLNIAPNKHTFYINNFTKEDLINWHRENVILESFPTSYSSLIRNYRVQKVNSIKSFIKTSCNMHK